MSPINYLRRQGKEPASVHLFECLALDGTGFDRQKLLKQRQWTRPAQLSPAVRPESSRPPAAGAGKACAVVARSTAGDPAAGLVLRKGLCAGTPPSPPSPQAADAKDDALPSEILFNCLALEHGGKKFRPSRRHARAAQRPTAVCAQMSPDWTSEDSTNEGTPTHMQRGFLDRESELRDAEAEELAALPAFLREIMKEDKEMPKYVPFVPTGSVLGSGVAAEPLSEVSTSCHSPELPWR
uniref:Uncharacterized protein n=1 Tax=Alexandrium monilatum TaxID=311494 RepID=A0A7S4RSQ7_9DINO